MSNKNKQRGNRSDKPGKKPTAGDASSSTDTVGLSWPVVVAAGSGLLAAWVAAGSAGALVTPLRHALVGLLLGVALVAVGLKRRQWALVAVIIALGVALSLLAGGWPVVDVLAVAAVLATLVFGTTGRRRRVLTITATAAGALAVFRAACFTVPTVWVMDGGVGFGLGWLAGLLGGPRLWLGGSLGGFDLLLVMGVFYVGWLRGSRPPRRARALYAAIAILLVEAVYLIVLSHSVEITAALPEPPMPESLEPGDYRPPGWSVGAELRGCLPWNVPLLAAVLQAAVAMAMLRWTRLEGTGAPLRYAPATQDSAPATQDSAPATQDSAPATEAGATGVSPVPTDTDGSAQAGRSSRWLLAVAILVAVATGGLSAWPPGGGDLSDRTIVAYRGGDVDWIVPTHDALGPDQTGVYGLLPSLVADLGGRWLLSEEFSEEELEGADVLLVIQPTEPWPEDRLERVEEFVRGGGSLLVVANPMVEAELAGDRQGQTAEADSDEQAVLERGIRPANRLLGPTGMAFRHDTALAATTSWMGALCGSTHPAVFGLSDLLSVSLRSSCTIEMSWPARAILVGRWGWSEPGSGGYAALGGGEKWGDLVLAAERPLGGGTVVALGDSWCLTNLGLADGHELAGRLLCYLADRPSSPQSMPRQALAVWGYLALLVLVVRRADSVRIVAIALTLAIVVTASMCYARATGPVARYGGLEGDSPIFASQKSGQSPARESGQSPARPIAYIDASHLEIGNDQPWANDGLDGFVLTLARNGYLPLKLHRWERRRLERAALLAIMGPARPFSADELEEIRRFIEDGGHVICMIGATEAAAGRALLDGFEFDIRPSPSPTRSGQAEAEPMGRFPDRLGESADEFGRFATHYFDAAEHGLGNYRARVWFFNGWPINCRVGDALILVRGYDEGPLVISQSLGKKGGKIVLIGDSRFALNHNHGYYDGRMTEGVTENADFWRWFLTKITGRPEWFPPDPARRARQGQKTFRTRSEVIR